MIALSIDTSSYCASLGLFEYNTDHQFNLLGKKDWEKAKSHSEVITVYTQDLLQSCGQQLCDIDTICVGLGPGSFTGIRVAVNFVKSLSYSLDIPVYAKNSLLPVGFNNRHLSQQTLVLTNAFRNMVYGSGFSNQPFQEIVSPFSCSPKDLEIYLKAFDPSQKILVMGNGYDLYKDFFDPTLCQRFTESNDSQTAVCSQALFEYFLQDKSPELICWNKVVPIYIRDSEAEEKLKTFTKLN